MHPKVHMVHEIKAKDSNSTTKIGEGADQALSLTLSMLQTRLER